MAIQTRLTDLPRDVLLHVATFLSYYDRLSLDAVLYGALGGRGGSHLDLATTRWRVAGGGPGAVGPAVPADLSWFAYGGAPQGHVILSYVDAATDADALALWRACLRWDGYGPSDPVPPNEMPDDFIVDYYGSFARSPSFNRAVAAAAYADLAGRAGAQVADLRVSVSLAFDSSCARNDLDVARWLTDTFKFDLHNAMYIACEFGHLDLARHVVRTFGAAAVRWHDVVAACATGDLALMDYLARVAGHYYFPVETAALSGSLKAVRWAVRRQLAVEKRGLASHASYEWRGDSDRCERCEEIEREHAETFVDVARYAETAVNVAAERATSEIIAYLYNAYRPPQNAVTDAFDELCQRGCAAAARRLAAAAPDEVTEDVKYRAYLRVFALARLGDGHRAVLAWLGEGAAAAHRQQPDWPTVQRALEAGPARARYLAEKLGLTPADVLRAHDCK